MTSAARHHQIVGLYSAHGAVEAARILGCSDTAVKYHAVYEDCGCLSNGSTPRTCATHGHVEVTKRLWGRVCRYCGLRFPERPERKDGVGGRWLRLGGEGSESRLWVPE